MRHLLSFSVVLFVSVFLFAADEKKPAVQPIKVVKLERTSPVLYDKDVEPILVNKCIFCHSGKLCEGGLDMNTYEALIKGDKRGSPVIPGNADNSLMDKSARRAARPFMPPATPNNEPATPHAPAPPRPCT